jgi:hypothetical integral membrane protein (TIGR02206 family)
MVKPVPFHPFSTQHGLAVLIGCIAIALILLIGKHSPGGQKFTTRLLAFLCLTAYPLSLLAWLSISSAKSLDNWIPFHLCDIAAITGGLALLTKKSLLASLTYFWGLAATIQALLTPAITVGFPSWPFVMFFVHHFAIVGTALYLPIVTGWRPKSPFWKSPLEVYGWSLGYLAFAMLVNKLLHTNFGFAAHPPENPSLIDYLGPWPWYLLWMSLIALVLYLLLALPFVRSKRAGK